MIAYFVKMTYFTLVIICVVYMSLLLVYDGDELNSVLRDFFYVEPVVRRGIRFNDSVRERLHLNNKMLNPSISEEEILMINEVGYQGFDSTTHDQYSFDYKLGNNQRSNDLYRLGTVGIPTDDQEIKINLNPLVIKEDREFYILKYVFGIHTEKQGIEIKINPLVIKEVHSVNE